MYGARFISLTVTVDSTERARASGPQLTLLTPATSALVVLEPITIIVGAPDLFVNKGSTINLTCVVKYAPEPPPMMIWSHNTEVSVGIP